MLAGLLVFIIVEKLFSLSEDEITDEKVLTGLNTVNNNHKDLGKAIKCNNSSLEKETSHIQVSYFSTNTPYSLIEKN